MSHEGTMSDHLSWWLSKSWDRVLPHPSAIFHVKISTGSLWVARTLSQCTSMKQGKVLSNSVTIEATKFVGPHISRMRQYIIKACCNGAQLTRSLIDTGGGYHLWISKYENRPLSLLPIWYSPVSPSCPARSHRDNKEPIANINHRGTPSWEGT
jgi:hypothetical protein